MSDRGGEILQWLLSIPDAWLYILIGAAAAIENVIPPFPGDVIVLIGGAIAGAGNADPRLLFLIVWLSNVASALMIYGLGRRYGASFFAGRFGSFLLAPAQVDALSIAYQRHGLPIIFLSRFLPVFRPIVPVFAGVAGLGLARTAVPIAAASAIWYGLVVYLGAMAGENLTAVLDLFERIGGGLGVVAGVLIALFVFWWWRTRAAPDSAEDS